MLYGVAVLTVFPDPLFPCCRLTEKYVQPFANLLYPGVGADLDSHHGFVVEYELGKDTNLGFHVDDSEASNTQ